MKYQGRLILVGIHILTLIISSIYLALKDVFSVQLILFLVTIILPYWWMGKKLDDSENLNKELENTNVELGKMNVQLTQNIEEYKQSIDDLNMNFLSYDVVKNEYFVFKGVRDIYGFSFEDIAKYPTLLNEIIHHEDIDKILDKEGKLIIHKSPIKLIFRIIRNEEIIWMEKNSVPIFNELGQVIKVNSLLTNISERKLLEEKLKKMAYYDELTDLPNRKLVSRHLTKAIARSSRKKHNLIVMFLDLDGFKKVNDTLGHKAGDSLLIEVAKRLLLSVREEDLVARLGGDEFIIVFEETLSPELEMIAQRIIDSISTPYIIGENETKISPSIGISIYPEDGEDKETLIHNADKAMYFAKNNGKNNYKFYSSELDSLEIKKRNVFDKFVDAFLKKSN